MRIIIQIHPLIQYDNNTFFSDCKEVNHENFLRFAACIP